MFVDLNGERTTLEDVTDVAALQDAVSEYRVELSRPVNADHEHYLRELIADIEDQIQWLVASETVELVAA